LTRREREVLRLVAEGFSSREIATGLGVSAKTVETHRSRLMSKLGIHKTSKLVRFALEAGVLDH
jgi:DNA-binding NarL/FixJ family response regulator